MFERRGNLWEHYGQLKKLEKLFELNLSIIEELETILWDNLEELEDYLSFLEDEERIFAEKIRASLRTILQHLEDLKDKTERNWEEVEITIIHLLVHKRPVNPQTLKEIYFGEFYRKLEVLKDYLNLHRDLFRDEFEKYKLFKKFPADIYIRFLEKLTEFNREFWR
jgi:hypothetical protein